MPQQNGSYYHVHFSEAKGFTKATQLASGGIRILYKGWPVINVILPCSLFKTVITKCL